MSKTGMGKVKPVSQKFMGSGQLLNRLISQVGGNKSLAVGLLKQRRQMNNDGSLSELGKSRNKMTAQQRAISRAVKIGHSPSTAYTYNPKTNRATLKNGQSSL